MANWVKENTDPPIYPNLKVHQLNGNSIIEVSIKESDEKPVFFKNHAFQRVGKTNQRISASKIRELAKQERVKLYWDEKICERANLEDIDEEKVKWFLQKARKEPDFEEIGGGFLVKFYAPEDILALIPEPTKVNLEELGLNKRQIEALRMMVNEGRKFTIEEYAKTFVISKKTAIRDFKKLREANFVTKIGVKKGAFYVAYEYVPKK